MDWEIKNLKAKIMAMKQKRFDKKCELVLNSIEGSEEKINEELKQPLIKAINKKREQGFRDTLFL